MFNWDEFSTIMVFVAFFILLLGVIYATPVELENGCIVHNNKVYCEEVNKVEE